ncbi:MAG: energy transducer TonB [Spongiibacteraceae bacterium]|nr:energy transducer TonB [Spongiibacteraceae bacterium]
MTQSGSLPIHSFFSDDLSYGSEPAEPSHDRLGFAFCLALIMHCAIILGINFTQEDRSLAPAKLEITLAQHRSEKSPDEADFLAQANQQGSGTLDEKAMLTTQEQADYQDTKIQEVSPQQQLSSQQTLLTEHTKISTMHTQQIKTREHPQHKPAEHLERWQPDGLTIVERNKEIASVQAKFDIQHQAYAKRPRIRRLTSLATKQSDDALYLHNWRTKIEAIGNQHYPVKARQQGLHGGLRVVVSLLPNGDIHQVRILKSSGYKILDQAAIRIVHLAAPFDPFPHSIGRTVDILEIIRTWHFHKGKLISSS